jgi:hypothetical protein
MYTLRTHAMISGGLFLLILVMAWGGAALQASGVVKHPEQLQTPMKIVFLTLFVLFAFSMVPTMVKLFLAAHQSIGNADKALIQFLDRHQVAVIWTFWGLWIAGLGIALPAMIRDGFLADSGGSNAASRDSDIARQIAAMPVQGILVAAPGMTVAEMIRGSTLKIDRGSNPAAPGQSQYAGGAIFDYHVADSAIEFHRCRYYFVTTYTKDPSRIEAINVGTSPSEYSRVELEAANAALRARLRKDGWLTGHEVYRTKEDRQLHGGKTRGEEGALWLKNGIVLDIETRRLDDPKPGEDPATAGEWTQYVELRTRVDFPLIERYVFAPPQS